MRRESYRYRTSHGTSPARLGWTRPKECGTFKSGNLTDDQLIRAIRGGVGSKGPLFPIMPYNSFHFMADTDIRDLVAHLRTVPAVANQVS